MHARLVCRQIAGTWVPGHLALCYIRLASSCLVLTAAMLTGATVQCRQTKSCCSSQLKGIIARVVFMQGINLHPSLLAHYLL